MADYHVRLSRGWESTKEKKKSVSRRVSFIEKGQIDKWGQRRQADILREYDNQALDLLSWCSSKTKDSVAKNYNG